MILCLGFSKGLGIDNMTRSYSITFETKCYENDWEFILKGSYLKQMVARCNVDFDFKQLIINNVKNRELVEQYAQLKVKEGVIDAYYFAEDTEEVVLNFFNIPKESFGKGFVYSISELTGIYKCTTDYLLHFSSDAYPARNAVKSNWIDEAIQLMSSNSQYVVATLHWNHLFLDAKAESYGCDKNFWTAQGMSDQCYLIPINIFRKEIYNEKHLYSERYPEYGGELFEKRVDAFLRNKNYYRLIYKKASYIHGNFPKNKIKRKIYFIITKILNNEFTSWCRYPSFFRRQCDFLYSVYKTVFHKYKDMTHKDIT